MGNVPTTPLLLIGPRRKVRAEYLEYCLKDNNWVFVNSQHLFSFSNILSQDHLNKIRIVWEKYLFNGLKPFWINQNNDLECHMSTDQKGQLFSENPIFYPISLTVFLLVIGLFFNWRAVRAYYWEESTTGRKILLGA